MEDRLFHRKQSPNNQGHRRRHSWEIWNVVRCDGNLHGCENGCEGKMSDERDGGCENDDAESGTSRAARMLVKSNKHSTFDMTSRMSHCTEKLLTTAPSRTGMRFQLLPCAHLLHAGNNVAWGAGNGRAATYLLRSINVRCIWVISRNEVSHNIRRTRC